MYQLKVMKEEKTSNPDGGKHIVRILQGYGYDVRLVFDIESYSAVNLSETDMDQIIEEYANVKELFHELDDRKEEFFRE